MNSKDLQNRTKKFAIEIIKLAEFLPNKQIGWTITNQIVRSAMSVAANYRAVCRAKSDRDFISKMGTVIEESDETLFWLELIEESNIIKSDPKIDLLKREANELTAIFVSSVKTIKKRIK
ncbi:four helix bundle protein [Ancylomarina sp. DW003]|nr:four helix bundle protein [Ancylomarina sp. DW003]MDE5422789.1 four helix bundle protein [Ancylomarina sp. DW003]